MHIFLYIWNNLVELLQKNQEIRQRDLQLSLHGAKICNGFIRILHFGWERNLGNGSDKSSYAAEVQRRPWGLCHKGEHGAAFECLPSGGIESNISLLIDQALDRLLEQKQLTIGWKADLENE